MTLHVEQVWEETLRLEEGSLDPALNRMTQSGWLRSERWLPRARQWGVSENDRRISLVVNCVVYSMSRRQRRNWPEHMLSVRNASPRSLEVMHRSDLGMAGAEADSIAHLGLFGEGDVSPDKRWAEYPQVETTEIGFSCWSRICINRGTRTYRDTNPRFAHIDAIQ